MMFIRVAHYRSFGAEEEEEESMGVRIDWWCLCCFFRERSRSKAVFGFACTYFCMGARRRWMLWMIDNGIHDLLLCASICYTCRWRCWDSRVCHAAARRWHGIGLAQSSALGSDDKKIRASQHRWLVGRTCLGTCIEKRLAALTYRPLTCSWRLE